MTARPRLALWLLCVAVYLCFAPGRILYPDDEIVFQTTRAMWERGDLAIEGIPKRTGENKGRPDGTFGWAPGVDGRRYGFFGHALSVVALPLYGVGRAAITEAPPKWRYVIRSDHYFMHRRAPHEDWPRLLVSLTNAFITALAAVLFAQWLVRLDYRPKIAIGVALVYAFGTSAWAYSGTFLSEPLSTVMLLAALLGITEFHRRRADSPTTSAAWLWMAGLVAGLSVHAHVLNVLAAPSLLGYAIVPLVRDGTLARHRAAWLGALALGLLGPALLGWTQAMRFGDPWQTGRYDHYGYFVNPLPGAVGQLVGPGRSLLWYSPALLLALPGWRRALVRHRAVVLTIAGVFLLRWGFVATRSDWWGGWGIGPRYLLPLLPLLLLPLATMLDDPGRTLGRGRRALLAVGIGVCVLVSGHLALHSIFEWMLRLLAETPPSQSYLWRSHWDPSASPILGFASLPPDILLVQAHRLAQHGHPGPWRIYLVIMAIAIISGGVLLRWFWRDQPPASPPELLPPELLPPESLPAVPEPESEAVSSEPAVSS